MWSIRFAVVGGRWCLGVWGERTTKVRTTSVSIRARVTSSALTTHLFFCHFYEDMSHFPLSLRGTICHFVPPYRWHHRFCTIHFFKVNPNIQGYIFRFIFSHSPAMFCGKVRDKSRPSFLLPLQSFVAFRCSHLQLRFIAQKTNIVLSTNITGLKYCGDRIDRVLSTISPTITLHIFLFL